MPIRIDPASPLALAIDIGGTKMRAGIVSADGKLVRRSTVPTLPRDGIENACERLIGAIVEAVGEDSVAGLGLASAGPMYPDSGTYDNPPSLYTWHGKTMKPQLERSLGVPVHCGHDATLAAFAEYNFGEHRQANPLIYFTISTGIGGGLVANGEMVTGYTGLAGEFGHIIVEPDSERSCGGNCRGCVESIASGTSVVNRARQLYPRHPDSALMQQVAGQLDKITTSLVFNSALEGDPTAQKIIDEATNALAIAFAAVLNALDPQIIVVGGGVAQHLAPLWDQLQKLIAERALMRFSERVPVALTTLGDEISMLGAAAMIFQKAAKELKL